MVDSIQRGLDIKLVLKPFLQHSTLALSNSDWEKMEEMVNVLGPVKVTMEALCRDDADLLSAEVALKKLFKTLRAYDSPFSHEVCDALVVEIGKRWQKDVAGLLKYLNNPDKLIQAEVLGKRKKKPSDAFPTGIILHFSTTYFTL